MSTPGYPNARDCEHGHLRGKCVACDLNEADARIADLEREVAAARLAGARAMQEAAARSCEGRIPSLRRSAASALSNGREVVACCRESDVETCERIAAAIRALVPEDVVKEADRG